MFSHRCLEKKYKLFTFMIGTTLRSRIDFKCSFVCSKWIRVRSWPAAPAHVQSLNETSEVHPDKTSSEMDVREAVPGTISSLVCVLLKLHHHQPTSELQVSWWEPPAASFIYVHPEKRVHEVHTHTHTEQKTRQKTPILLNNYNDYRNRLQNRLFKQDFNNLNWNNRVGVRAINS